MTIVAKAKKGQEFLYNPRSAHKVSKSSAQWIADGLNAAGYQLNAGEIWHIFDIDRYDTAYLYAISQDFRRYNGNIREYGYNYGF